MALGQGDETDRGKHLPDGSESARRCRELTGHAPGGVHDVRFSADGRSIFSCGRDTAGARLDTSPTASKLAELASHAAANSRTSGTP